MRTRLSVVTFVLFCLALGCARKPVPPKAAEPEIVPKPEQQPAAANKPVREPIEFVRENPQQAEEKQKTSGAEKTRNDEQKRQDTIRKAADAKAVEVNKFMEPLSAGERKAVKEYARTAKLETMPVNDRQPLNSLPTGAYGYLEFVAPGVEVKQVINEREMLVSGRGDIGREQGSFWIEGIDTADVTDDSVIALDKVILVVAGTKTYKTVGGGSRTVKRFTVLDTSKISLLIGDPDKRKLLLEWEGK